MQLISTQGQGMILWSPLYTSTGDTRDRTAL